MAEEALVAEFEKFFSFDSVRQKLEDATKQYPKKKSFELHLNELSGSGMSELSDKAQERPDSATSAAEEAISRLNLFSPNDVHFRPRVRFCSLEDTPGWRPMVMDLGTQHLDKLVSVEGVISSISEIKPRMKIALWRCANPDCGHTTKTATDKTLPIVPPLQCESCHKGALKLEEQTSEFVDMQRASLQDPVEKLRGNTPAVHADLWMEDDFVNQVAPGDKVVITGVLRLKPILQGKGRSSVYAKFLDVFHIRELQIEFEELEITREEEEGIKKLAADPKLYEKIVGSIAPSIYGYNELKQSIALQLFGGTPNKIMPDGERTRSDIHILMVGDPGCVRADERIVQGNGAITRISKLGTEHLERINLPILTGEGGGKRDVATVFHKYENQQVIEIITESGKSIAGTRNHPLMCYEGPVRVWKRIDQIRPGDKVVVVSGIPCSITAQIPTGFKHLKKRVKHKINLPQKVTPELAEIIGYALGDGYVTKNDFGLIVAEPEKDILPKLVNKFKSIFKVQPTIYPVVNKGRTVPIYRIRLYSTDLCANLSFLREKRVPDIIFKSGNKVAAAFLKWLFEADGTVFDNGRGRRAVGLKAKDLELLRDVQMLLLRFGIHSRLDANALLIRRGKDILKFADKIGFASQKKKTKLAGLAEHAKEFGRRKGQRYEKVVKMVLHPLQTVYDIEVPGAHRFIANGVISHNTGKSTMLEYVASLAPKAVVVSGGSASGVGLCVSPDSLILNDNGLKTISEFVESNWKGEAKEELPGAFAQQFSGNAWTLGPDLKISREKISKIWRIRAPPEMVRVTTRMGRQIELTPATSLVCIEGTPVWKKSAELKPGEFVATARTLPEGGSKGTPSLKLLEDCPNLFVEGKLNAFFRKITDALGEKYGSIRNMARAYGMPEGTIYDNRTQKRWSNVRLEILSKMSRDAGMEDELEKELLEKVESVFLRYGHNTKIPPYLENEKLAYLAGLLLGDGDCRESGNSATMRFSNTNDGLLKKFSEIALEVFGIKTKLDKPSWKIPSIRFGSIPAFILLKKLGLHTKKTMISLSHDALCMPNKVLAQLLQGLFDTDGYVSIGKDGSHHIGVSTVSPMLAKTLHLALLKFGVNAKLRMRKKAGKVAYGKKITVTSRHDAHVIEIRGAANLKAFADSIGFSHAAKASKLSKIISVSKPNTNVDVVPVDPSMLSSLEWGYRKGKTRPSREMLSKAAQKSGNNFLSKLSQSDIFWDEIVSVQRFAPEFEWVYDFSVENSHNFICNGFFTHNTASAERDELTEGWVLKAGAMVLANGGIICLDEADKMDEEDRGAMHQAMEQQKINVAKAGIVTEFQTKCSVLAAANPKLGRFDPNTPIPPQFALSPALLSRFDLIFPMRDTLDETKDKKMAEHILKGHILASTLARTGKIVEAENTGQSIVPVIDKELLRKYIAFARKTVAPQMTAQAGDVIRDYYVQLRRLGMEQNTIPVTARQIEGLIRLAEAGAKMRLSPVVEVSDAQRSIDLSDFVLKEVFVDKETGKLDSDVIALGQPKSKLDKIRSVIGIINNMQKEIDMVAIDEVIKESSNYGIDETYARRLVEELIKQGDLYEYKPGYIKTARKSEW